jgi:ATP-binding cassette, subfamily B, bacterial PglK
MLKLLKQLQDILPSTDKRKFVGMFFMMFIAAVLEVVGISLILAFISIVAEPDRVLQLSWLAPTLTNLGIEDSKGLLLYGSLTLITIFHPGSFCLSQV